MKLWSIQPIDIYEIIQRDGVYITDETKIDMPSFLEPYHWMSEQLQKKTPRPEGVTIPVWGWYQFMGKRKKPDLRYACYGARGTKCVCMELDIPDEEVLLSDFEAWLWVLNDWWLSNSNNEEEDNRLEAWYEKQPADVQKKLKIDSWQSIFNLTYMDNGWRRQGYEIQGVFWMLKKEYIKKVQFFTAR